MNTHGAEQGSTDFEAEAIRDKAEIDILEKRAEVREGIEADKALRQIATKEQIRLQQIGDKYLRGQPYERERVVAEIRLYLEQTVEGMIEAGKRLIAMKEAEKHGEWIHICEERIGVSQPTAWRFMAIARKFQNIHAVNHLKVSFTDGVGKLYALLSVPDEELAEFDETGLFRGCTADAIDKMSVSQFRKLIAEKEDWKARTRQLELEFSHRRDTTDRLKKANEKLKKENAALVDALDHARKGLPEDAEAALEMLAHHRDDALAAYHFLRNSDPSGCPEIVRADILNTGYFLRDVYLLLSHELSNKYDVERPYPAPALAVEDKAFNNTYAAYLDLEREEG